MERYEETPIIIGFDAAEVGPIPQMSNTPKFLVLRTRIEGGRLDLRLSEAAAAELAEALPKLLRARGSQ
jgi:hypothetical protein